MCARARFIAGHPGREGSARPRLACPRGAVAGETIGSLQWETDRARFLGRGRAIRAPAATAAGRALSDTTGAVLDPIVSLRRRVRVPAGETVRVAFSTLVAPSRADALDLAEKYRDPATFDGRRRWRGRRPRSSSTTSA